jgi:hypothetical protein
MFDKNYYLEVWIGQSVIVIIQIQITDYGNRFDKINDRLIRWSDYPDGACDILRAD